jgi:hypothetical protein
VSSPKTIGKKHIMEDMTLSDVAIEIEEAMEEAPNVSIEIEADGTITISAGDQRWVGTLTEVE